MGLQERRAIEEFKTKSFPEFKKQIDQVTGFDLPVEVQWDTLAEEGYAHMYAEAFPKVYFEPLIEALKSICADAMGKDALKKSVQKVLILNSGGGTYGSFTLEGGTLTVNHQPVTNVDYVDERTKGIREVLESKL